MTNILIANRGEIAIRIARAAADLGIRTVAVHSADDSKSLHIRAADQVCALKGTGAAAYLNIEQIISVARAAGCDAIHPGYGFLSENAVFARRCAEEGITFIGPKPDVLELFGDKIRARALAKQCGVPLLPGTHRATSLQEAKDFFLSLGENAAVMIKAVIGGGGRGMRPVYNLSDLDEAYERCQSEAQTAFGHNHVYIEQLICNLRHIEVQIIGDGKQVVHLGERDCTMQRRNQKLIEIAPCPTLSPKLINKITEAALHLAQESRFDSLGTMEFLVYKDVQGEEAFAFIETNPRLQVEHTVTEEVTGVDLVRTQIEIAAGKSLADLGLTENAAYPRSRAMELRINMETIDATGSAYPTSGTISVYEAPLGPGIRVDGYGYSGYTTNPSFDSLLAKLIVTSDSPRYIDLVAKAYRALSEFRVEGVATNIPFLLNLLRRPEVAQNTFNTRFIEENAAELVSSIEPHRKGYFDYSPPAKILSIKTSQDAPEGSVPVKTPIQGCIVSINIGDGDPVAVGQTIAIIEAMKMEHEIKADQSGYVYTVCATLGEVVPAGAPICFLNKAEIDCASTAADRDIDLDEIRPDLAEVIARHAVGLDINRPEAVASRHQKGLRTIRENIEDLCDPDSFIEYGALAIAAQRSRRSIEELIKKTPADGLIAGIGSVNSSLFGDEKSRCMIIAYDYTVLAGTQGLFGHKKKDRMLGIAHEWRLPTIFFAEGGGGRPGDIDAPAVAGLDLTTFARFGGLSGKVPLIGVVSGYCFAGNAALLGCCDVIIATMNSNIGMGGPAMIEGGGLGVVRPEEIGPIDVQTKNGVVDIVVEDETEAVAVAKKYISYFQGPTNQWESADQRILRRLIPENRLRVYNIRAVLEALADTESVLELRPHYGLGMITALIRIEGKPFGVIANNPKHLSGAIAADDADKAARFWQLCDAHNLPIISLVDTPGFMVGPEVETHAQVRHVCRMFVVGSHLSVPFFTVILRKAYGLGAQAMVCGSFHSSFFTAAWPSAEFGPMGLEGAAKHAYRRELAEIEDPAARDAAFKSYVDEFYKAGKATNMASYFEIDSVIDPADTRKWLVRGLKSVQIDTKNKKERFIDTW
ncbi:MAG: biotin/lipoyl-binding protein [Dethiobacter sp.]|nr:biotin/lipoyl-binding protein [Dethiobacter sp.]